MLKCSACKFTVEDNYHLTRHMEAVHFGLKPHQCDQCSYATGFSSTLKNHKKIHHGGEKNHSCPHCELAFYSVGELNRHVRTKHNVEPNIYRRELLSCKDCGFVAGSTILLKQHAKKNHNLSVYKCDECKFTTPKRSNLSSHKNSVHLGIKPHKCDHCSYATGHPSNLKAHMRTHGGAKSKTFECLTCDKSFSKRWNLEVHKKRVHDREANFAEEVKTSKEDEIQIPNAEVKQENCDALPLPEQNGVKPYKTDRSYAIGHSSNLKAHMRTHGRAKRKMYKCHVCDKSFKKRWNLEEHKKNVHHKEVKFAEGFAEEVMTSKEDDNQIPIAEVKQENCDSMPPPEQNGSIFGNVTYVSKDGKEYTKMTKTHMRRQKISQLLEMRVPHWKIVQIVGCSRNMIRTVRKMRNENKSLAPNFSGGKRKSRTQEALADVPSLLAKKPGMSIKAMAKHLGVSRMTLRNFMRSKSDNGEEAMDTKINSETKDNIKTAEPEQKPLINVSSLLAKKPGMSIKFVANQSGVSHTTLRSFMIGDNVMDKDLADTKDNVKSDTSETDETAVPEIIKTENAVSQVDCARCHICGIEFTHDDVLTAHILDEHANDIV